MCKKGEQGNLWTTTFRRPKAALANRNAIFDDKHTDTVMLSTSSAPEAEIPGVFFQPYLRVSQWIQWETGDDF